MTVENTNLIEAGGRIVRARRANNGNVIVTLLINDHRHIAQVPFIHYGLIDRSMMGNTKVLVKGHVYVSPTYDEILRRQNERPSFLMDDIQIRETQMQEAFGVRGRFCGTDYFMGKFTGTIRSLVHTSNENWGEMFVDVDGYNGNTPSTVVFNYFLKGRLPSLARFKEGDRVAILSSVHTSTKTIRGEERTFVNLGVEDIVKINESADADPAPEPHNGDGETTENRRERRRRRRLLVTHNENLGSTPEEPGTGLPTTDEVNAGLVDNVDNGGHTSPAPDTPDDPDTPDAAPLPQEAEAGTSPAAPAPAATDSPVDAIPADKQEGSPRDDGFVRNGYAEDTEAAPVSFNGEEETTLYSGQEEGPSDPDTDTTDPLGASPALADDDDDSDDSDFLSQFK